MRGDWMRIFNPLFIEALFFLSNHKKPTLLMLPFAHLTSWKLDQSLVFALNILG